jgi:proteic killer suppression protein
MIRSFKHRGLKRLYEQNDRSGIRPDLVDKVERILTALDSAGAPQALDIPATACTRFEAGGKGFGR